MIMNILKGLWKWILWILILLVLGGAILAFRIFVIDKDYNEKGKNASDSSISSSANTNSKSKNNSNSSIEKDSESDSDSKIGSESNSNPESNDENQNSANNTDNGNNIDEKNNNSRPREVLDNIKNTINTNTISEKAGSLGQTVVNGAKAIGNSVVKGYKEDEERYTYNAYNFDEWFLIYEGEQNDGAIRNVLDHLITNADGDFYARTSVTAVGFGNNNTINYNGDVTEYQNAIRNMKNSVSGGRYEVSFKYAGIMTYVNEIVITKK